MFELSGTDTKELVVDLAYCKSQLGIENNSNSKQLKQSWLERNPLMHKRIKSEYPDTILLIRVGDFCETFSEDAIKASKVLGILLAKEETEVLQRLNLQASSPPLETYLPKLVRAGLKVAVCDQLEDPKQAKGIVKRGVTELVTPVS